MDCPAGRGLDDDSAFLAGSFRSRGLSKVRQGGDYSELWRPPDIGSGGQRNCLWGPAVVSFGATTPNRGSWRPAGPTRFSAQCARWTPVQPRSSQCREVAAPAEAGCTRVLLHSSAGVLTYLRSLCPVHRLGRRRSSPSRTAALPQRSSFIHRNRPKRAGPHVSHHRPRAPRLQP